MDTFLRTRKDNVVEIAAWLFLAVMVTVVLKTLAFLFVPLAIALLLCYVLGTPIELLQRLRMPVFLRILVVVFVALLFFYLLGTLVRANVADFQRQLPEFEVKFWGYAGTILERLHITPAQAREMFYAFFDNFKQSDLKPLGAIMQWVGDSFFTLFGNVIWVLLFMVFILAERESIMQRIVLALGEESSGPVLDTVRRINKAVQHYLGLKALISFITGALVAAAMFLFNVPFALLWGVLAFLLNFIPNIGSLVAAVLPVAIALFDSGSVGKTIMVAAVFVIIQITVGNFLEPKMMGRGLDLSPLVVLLSLIFWGWMWGMTGMLLSVPLTAAVKIAFEQLDSTRPVALLMSGR